MIEKEREIEIEKIGSNQGAKTRNKKRFVYIGSSIIKNRVNCVQFVYKKHSVLQTFIDNLPYGFWATNDCDISAGSDSPSLLYALTRIL